MTKRPFLLITNDDGIHAPGLKHLWQSVHEWADTAIVAPSSEKSGSGLSITWTRPLMVKSIPWEGASAWSVSGTPADCVKMAIHMIIKRKPDLIISGINRGSNSGRTVLYSGTVGGVIEGALKGIPGIAFSFSDVEPPSLEATKSYISPLIQYVLKHPMPAATFLNVTFPVNCEQGVKGFKLARQGKGYWVEDPEQRIHPEGTPYYWLGGRWGGCEEDPESDVAYAEQGYVTAAPIHVGDLTDQQAFDTHKDRINSLFSQEATVNKIFNS